MLIVPVPEQPTFIFSHYISVLFNNMESIIISLCCFAIKVIGKYQHTADWLFYTTHQSTYQLKLNEVVYGVKKNRRKFLSVHRFGSPAIKG